MDKASFLFNGWEPIARIIIVGTLACLTLVLLLRTSSKRTLSKMNAFDFIVTVALGASFGRILTARKVALSEAITAFALLVLLQFIVSWLQTRFPKFDKLISDEPRILFYDDSFLHEQMKQERITEDNLKSALRERGLGSFEQVKAIIFESSGKLSIIKKQDTGNGSALKGIGETQEKNTFE